MTPAAAAELPHLEIDRVSKRFGTVQAVADSSLAVRRGEIVAFLGPSGCGKSTLLNVIAGFEDPDSGEVRLAGRRLNDLPPNRRPTALVFQSYALFPHMTVWDNVSYGLRVRAMAAPEIAARTRECLTLLKLAGLERRYPGELSGGQRQRVAVARALAVRPEVLLLDEALSALDKTLREEMQIELSLLLRGLKITAILVTHDQREAFSLADRIAVMEAGRIVQVGAPEEVYARPRSGFVLGFLGQVNRLPVSLRPAGAEGVEICSRHGLAFRCPRERVRTDRAEALLCVRGEDIALSATPTEVHPGPPGVLRLGSFLGPTRRYVVELGDAEVVLERPSGAVGGEFRAGEAVHLRFPVERCLVLERD